MLIKLLDVVFGGFNSLGDDKQVVRCLRLTDKRNICSSGALSNILVLDTKVLAYSASAAGCRRVLVTDGFKVLILPYLCKGNYGAVSFDNSSVKLEVMGGTEPLTFLRHELRLF
jgi:hypothetical protein